MQLSRFFTPLLLIGGVFLFGLVVKLKDLKNFFNTDNVLSCFDCFLYARLSRELVEGNYLKIDYLRNVPDFIVNLYPPSLITLFPYILNKLFNLSLEYLYIFLPVIFSLLFIVPLFLWVKMFAPIHLFLGGAILGIFNLIYFSRTQLGRYDTDSLVLFFVFFIILLLTKAIIDRKKSYFYIVLVGVVFNLFMWWYYKPIFSLFFFFSLFLGLVAVRDKFKNIFYKLFLFLLLTGPWVFFEAIYGQLSHYFRSYFLKGNSLVLPVSINSSIIELQPVSFKNLVYFTTDNTFTVILGFLGLLLLIVRNFKYMSVALPIIAIGFTTFFAGNRFIIYLAPFLGMGLGYIFYLAAQFVISRYGINKSMGYAFSIILVVFFSFPPQRIYSEATHIIRDELWQSFKEIKPLLEKDGYIWSWWDYGYVLQYVFNKGTYTDNGSFDQLKIYFFAHSMMIYDEEKSRNIIAFATNNLSTEYGKNVKNLTDTWNLKEKVYLYNKEPFKPVYVFLFGGMLQKGIIHNLGVFGTGIYDDKVASVSVFQKCEKKKEYFDCGVLRYVSNGEIKWNNVVLSENPPYREVIFVDRDKREKRLIYSNMRYSYDRMLEIIKSKGEVYLIIANRKIKQSIFHKMLVFGDNFKYFEEVYSNFPHIVVYRVK